jgi:YVTN family beta-propeller protein
MIIKKPVRVGVISLAFLIGVDAQTVEQPARRVSDPGVVSTGQHITPAGTQTAFQSRVFGVTFGASAEEIWVLTETNVYRLSWAKNAVLQRVPFAGDAGLQGIQFDPLSGSAFISTSGADKAKGEKRSLVRLTSINGSSAKVIADQLGRYIAGALALARHDNSAGQRIAVVPLIYDNKLAVIDLKAEKLVGTVPTGIAPFGAAINDIGTIVYVTNWGGRVPTPGDLTATTGRKPGADRVVVDRRGIAATGTVTRIDLTNSRVTHTIAVGLHPTALAWDEKHDRLYVANSNSDSVSVIDTAQNRVVRSITLRPFREQGIGIAPTALAITADGAILFVACGGINAVAVYDTTSGELRGMIPTAWYPNGLALSGDGKYLAMNALLGVGSGWRGEPRKRHVFSYRGAVNVVALPDDAQLASYTTAVAENNRMTLASAPAPARSISRTRSTPVPLPLRSGEPSLIEHVVYIIKENRTYDQVLGDMKQGNGDPSLVMFGEAVTPNQHRLAQQFVLLDNFYATGGNSGSGHQWLTQANETDYTLWPGYVGRSYPFDGTDPIAYSQGGFIWDAALRMKKSVRVYGEFAPENYDIGEDKWKDFMKRWQQGETFTNEFTTSSPIPTLDSILAKNYPSYSTDLPDLVRARIFLADLKKWEQTGQMPHLVMLQLPCNHTKGLKPGAPSPKAMVANNDLALGQIVEALSKSPFWEKMAIFVVEDDAQDGVDHVDGHRTVALAISPYIRRGYVDSSFYAQPSMLKTIELILGLPALSLFDLTANEMRASFREKLDFTPYTAVQPKQSLLEFNSPLAGLRGPARRAALASMRMRFDVPDAAPSDRLNRILWHSVRGWNTPYPAIKHSVFFPMSIDLADEDR